ncbi:hypothetical protein [Novosphingobium sp.]|uniref:hypothetical protein n=1 Tax=Novosphingobium sp. TaxID=1874826 RepID=UPI0035AFDC8D
MPDEMFARPLATPRGGGTSLRALIGVTLLAFVGGALLVGYLVWNGRIEIGGATPAAPAASQAALPSQAASNAAVSVLDQRLAALEARLIQIKGQADAAEGNAVHAEALLVAFAARRAIERGTPLGNLEGQLKSRFGNSQPGAVQTVIEAAKNPLTLDQLLQQLDALAPALIGTPQDETGWDRFTRELGSLFVIRHGEVASPRPADRIERVRMLLRTGKVDAAADEVALMPASPEAAAWIANARRYATTSRALDQIEGAALADPVKQAPSSPQPGPASPAAPRQQ